LTRFGELAIVGEICVERALKRHFSLADTGLQSAELALRAEPIKLLVRVEHKRGPGKATRPAGARRVQPHDKEGATTNAK